MAKTLCSQCRGPRFHLPSDPTCHNSELARHNERLHMLQLSPGQINKYKKKKLAYTPDFLVTLNNQLSGKKRQKGISNVEPLRAPGVQILPPQPLSSHQSDATEHRIGKDSRQECLHTLQLLGPQTSEMVKMWKCHPTPISDQELDSRTYKCHPQPGRPGSHGQSQTMTPNGQQAPRRALEASPQV